MEPKPRALKISTAIGSLALAVIACEVPALTQVAEATPIPVASAEITPIAAVAYKGNVLSELPGNPQQFIKSEFKVDITEAIKIDAKNANYEGFHVDENQKNSPELSFVVAGDEKTGKSFVIFPNKVVIDNKEVEVQEVYEATSDTRVTPDGQVYIVLSAINTVLNPQTGSPELIPFAIFNYGRIGTPYDLSSLDKETLNKLAEQQIAEGDSVGFSFINPVLGQTISWEKNPGAVKVNALASILGNMSNISSHGDTNTTIIDNPFEPTTIPPTKTPTSEPTSTSSITGPDASRTWVAEHVSITPENEPTNTPTPGDEATSTPTTTETDPAKIQEIADNLVCPDMRGCVTERIGDPSLVDVVLAASGKIETIRLKDENDVEYATALAAEMVTRSANNQGRLILIPIRVERDDAKGINSDRLITSSIILNKLNGGIKKANTKELFPIEWFQEWITPGSQWNLAFKKNGLPFFDVYKNSQFSRPDFVNNLNQFLVSGGNVFNFENIPILDPSGSSSN